MAAQRVGLASESTDEQDETEEFLEIDFTDWASSC